MNHLLEARDISMHFGGVRAVDGISMYVDSNETLGVIGPNGSGKTTFFNALTGIYTPTAGSFWLKGAEITGKQLQEMTSLGVARTFQNLRIFKAMTVMENVLVGQNIRIHTSLWDALIHSANWNKSEKDARERAMVALGQVGLADMQKEIAGSMSYGLQKRLELARALVCNPELLLLDEPTAGMNSVEADELMNLVKEIREQRGIAVILIEHNMKVMMRTATRIMAMDTGRKIAEGTPEEIQNNEQVIRAYLGGND